MFHAQWWVYTMTRTYKHIHTNHTEVCYITWRPFSWGSCSLKTALQHRKRVKWTPFGWEGSNEITLFQALLVVIQPNQRETVFLFLMLPITEHQPLCLYDDTFWRHLTTRKNNLRIYSVKIHNPHTILSTLNTQGPVAMIYGLPHLVLQQ